MSTQDLQFEQAIAAYKDAERSARSLDDGEASVSDETRTLVLSRQIDAGITLAQTPAHGAAAARVLLRAALDRMVEYEVVEPHWLDPARLDPEETSGIGDRLDWSLIGAALRALES